MVKFTFNKGWRGPWTRCAAIRLMTFFGGIVVSSAVTHHFAEKKLREEFEQQLEEVKSYYKSRAEEDALKDDLLARYSAADVEATTDVMIEVQAAKASTKISEQKIRERVSTLSQLPDEQKDLLARYGYQQVNDIGGQGIRPPHPKTLPKIHQITREQYYDEIDSTWENQEKTSLLYYEEDDVIVNPIEDAVDDHANLLGTEFQNHFEVYNGSEYSFVRNTVIDTDYEIELVKGSYHRDVRGFDEDMKRTPRKFRRDE